MRILQFFLLMSIFGLSSCRKDSTSGEEEVVAEGTGGAVGGPVTGTGAQIAQGIVVEGVLDDGSNLDTENSTVPKFSLNAAPDVQASTLSDEFVAEGAVANGKFALTIPKGFQGRMLKITTSDGKFEGILPPSSLGRIQLRLNTTSRMAKRIVDAAYATEDGKDILKDPTVQIAQLFGIAALAQEILEQTGEADSMTEEEKEEFIKNLAVQFVANARQFLDKLAAKNLTIPEIMNYAQNKNHEAVFAPEAQAPDYISGTDSQLKKLETTVSEEDSHAAVETVDEIVKKMTALVESTPIGDTITDLPDPNDVLEEEKKDTSNSKKTPKRAKNTTQAKKRKTVLSLKKDFKKSPTVDGQPEYFTFDGAETTNPSGYIVSGTITVDDDLKDGRFHILSLRGLTPRLNKKGEVSVNKKTGEIRYRRQQFFSLQLKNPKRQIGEFRLTSLARVTATEEDHLKAEARAEKNNKVYDRDRRPYRNRGISLKRKDSILSTTFDFTVEINGGIATISIDGNVAATRIIENDFASLPAKLELFSGGNVKNLFPGTLSNLKLEILK